MEKILVVAAHPDDELLGVGGTVRRLSNEGKEIHAVIMAEGITSRAANRDSVDINKLAALQDDALRAGEIIGYQSIEFCRFPDNRMDGVELLDIIKAVASHVEKYNPDTIFTHHHGDLNIDHRRTCEAVLTACRPSGKHGVERIYAFETPSSSEWNYTYIEPFTPNVYFDITSTMDNKIKGMSCYRSESTVYPHPRSGEALIALAKLRGSNIGFEMAEAFMLLRECFAENSKNTIL